MPEQDATSIWGLLAIGILLFPLLGAVLAGGLGRALFRGQSHFPVIIGVGGAVICSLWAFFRISGMADRSEQTSWMISWWRPEPIPESFRWFVSPSICELR